MKRRILFLYSAAFLLGGCGADGLTQDGAQKTQAGGSPFMPKDDAAAAVTVALAGNAFVTSAAPGAAEIINENGLANWNSASTVTSAWFRVAAAGPVAVALDAKLPAGGNSTVRVTVNGTPFSVKLAGAAGKTYAVGTVNVAAPGYVKVDLQGISKSGAYLATWPR